jgi:hypothetical protein
MISVAIRSIGICAAGLDRWADAARVLVGDSPFVPAPMSRRPVEALAPTERRRINEISRLACLAAYDAFADAPSIDAAQTPTVFASADGDGTVLAQTLAALGQREVVMSPTAFHNSVYNAAAGYWSIAARATAASTTVCAAQASLAVAMLEGLCQMQATGGPVLVIAADAPFPDPIRALSPSRHPFACALLIDAVARSVERARLERWAVIAEPLRPSNGDAIDDAFAGNAAAQSLPMLRALARRQPARVSLPYLDGRWLDLEVVA